MSSSTQAREASKRAKPSWTAIGFAFAFALSTATIILTGLMVGAPERDDTRSQPGTAQAEPQQGATVHVERDRDGRRADGAAATHTNAERAEPAPTPSTSEPQ